VVSTFQFTSEQLGPFKQLGASTTRLQGWAQAGGLKISWESSSQTKYATMGLQVLQGTLKYRPPSGSENRRSVVKLLVDTATSLPACRHSVLIHVQPIQHSPDNIPAEASRQQPGPGYHRQRWQQ
jgi:hypothetical protein